MEGWVSLHRKITKNWIWNDRPFTKGQAFVDMILICNHADKKVNIKNELILCKRGESLNSLQTWADRWGWDKSKVRRFFKLLVSDSMVELKPTRNTTHLRLIKYGDYNNKRNTDETQMKLKRNAGETQMTLNNKDNNQSTMINNENNKLSFEKFWNLYDKKVGKKSKIEAKWNKLQDSDREKIIDHLPKYKISQPDSQYRKNPEAYLNNESWNDEIIDSQQSNNQKQIIVKC